MWKFFLQKTTHLINTKFSPRKITTLTNISRELKVSKNVICYFPLQHYVNYTINCHAQQLNENFHCIKHTLSNIPISCYLLPKLHLCLCLTAQMYACIFYLLVHLEVNVNVSYKFKGCYKGHSAQHQEKHIACQQRVTKELYRLKHARHVRSFVVVEHRVTKYKPRCGTENKRRQIIKDRKNWPSLTKLWMTNIHF